MKLFRTARIAAFHRAVGWLRTGFFCAVVTQYTVTARGAEALDAAWLAEAQAALRIPRAEEVAAAESHVHAALTRVTAQLNALPEGAMLQEALRLDSLNRMLSDAGPPGDEIQEVLHALRIKRPGGLEPLLADLRRAVESWASLAWMDERSLETARQQLSTLTTGDESSLRNAYSALARLHQIDNALADVRTLVSQPNHQMTVNAAYLHALATRTFEAPIDVRERREGTQITARGKLPVKTSLALPESRDQAVLRLMVEARGSMALTACRGKIRVAANSRVCLAGSQNFHLDATGVTPHEPSLNLGSRTRLADVNVNRRVGGRVAERVVGKVATKKLPQADRNATRAAKSEIEQRVSSECQQIAERINGLFRQLYVGPFLAFDVNPSLSFRSGSQGIDASANYARHDQLGALNAPPPTRVPMHELSYVTKIHESAINNLADEWGGARLDEATFWMILNEEFKFRGDDVERLPAGRVPAVLQLAEHSPVSLQLSHGALDVTLRVRGWGTQGDVRQMDAAVVHVRYRLAAAASGIALVRDGEIAVEPNATDDDKSVLSRFFPPQVTPRQRFDRAGDKQRLVIRELLLQDGWLVIGTGPMPSAASVASAKKGASR